MDFIVIDLRGDPTAHIIATDVAQVLRVHGLLLNNREMKYYGLSDLAEDITKVDYWRLELPEEEDEDGN